MFESVKLKLKTMGNSISFNHLHLSGQAKIASKKFDEDEMIILEKTWVDLADRTNGKGIDKDTFLQYFPLSGLLGERLFTQFDNKSLGYIEYDDFIIALAKVCR